MTDDRPESSERTDDSAEAADSMGAPGGGPRRVVSNRSVDDILDSLGSPDDDTPRDDAGPRTTDADAPDEPRDAIEPDVAEADDATERGESDRSDGVSDDATDAFSGPAADDDVADSDEVGDAEEVGDADADALAARIESGTVTGADVRAAEAGEDRGRTPEIDDIDLSLDDIDASATGSPSSSATEAGSTDGPLAGTIRGDDAAAGGDAADDADRSGLLGRIRRFFGG